MSTASRMNQCLQSIIKVGENSTANRWSTATATLIPVYLKRRALLQHHCDQCNADPRLTDNDFTLRHFVTKTERIRTSTAAATSPTINDACLSQVTASDESSKIVTHAMSTGPSADLAC